MTTMTPKEIISRHFAKLGKKGADAVNSSRTAKRRSEIARKAGRARQAKAKAGRKAA